MIKIMLFDGASAKCQKGGREPEVQKLAATITCCIHIKVTFTETAARHRLRDTE